IERGGSFQQFASCGCCTSLTSCARPTRRSLRRSERNRVGVTPAHDAMTRHVRLVSCRENRELVVTIRQNREQEHAGDSVVFVLCVRANQDPARRCAEATRCARGEPRNPGAITFASYVPGVIGPMLACG